MIDETLKVTKSGCIHYTRLPEGFRVATLADFITDGKRHIGKIFLIQWVHNAEVFQICYVSMTLTSGILNQYISDKRVFVNE